MFNFQFEDFPITDFGIETTDLNIFAFVPPYKDKLSLDVTITANERVFKGPEDDIDLKPVLSTQWLEIDLSSLKSNGADCLDGYHLKYDSQKEEELGFDQFPGAIYTYTWGAFEKAEMTFRYIGAGNYEIAAHGTTEYNWTFDLKAKVPLTKVDLANEDRQKDAAVEAFMHEHLSSEAFEFTWQDAFGGPTESWWHYRATPRR